MSLQFDISKIIKIMGSIMHLLMIKYWLKKICFLLLIISPALYKLVRGSEYYLLVDGCVAAGAWVSVICLLIDNKFKFCKKLCFAINSIFMIFYFYIVIICIGILLISKYLPLEGECIFLILIIGLFLSCLLVFWIFTDEIKEYEKYYRLIADGITAIIAIILLYDNYYGVSELVKILF